MVMDPSPPSDDTSSAVPSFEAEQPTRGGPGMPATVTTRRFTVDEYHRMAEAGVFHPFERVELIEGEIVQMAAIRSRHAECVDRLNRLLVRGIGDDATVRVQNPIRLNDRSEPEPDIAVVRRRPEGYADRHPRREEVRLVVEVSDATLALDREVKLPLYAAAGIPECWIVDLVADRIDVHRSPERGAYARTEARRRGEAIPFPSLADLRLRVVEVLPPPSER